MVMTSFMGHLVVPVLGQRLIDVLGLPAPPLRFELELFSSRTGSSVIYHDRSVHPEGLSLSRSALESENLKDVVGLKPTLSTKN